MQVWYSAHPVNNTFIIRWRAKAKAGVIVEHEMHISPEQQVLGVLAAFAGVCKLPL